MALGKRPIEAALAMDLFEVFRQLGRLDDAEAICRRLTETHPHSAQGWRGLAQLARQRGDRLQSLECWREALERDPGAVGVAIELSADLRELGRLDEAEAVAAAHREAFPDSASALIAYANAIRHKASKAELILCFERAAALEPNGFAAKMALASEYLTCWRIDDAEAVYDRALAENGRLVAALMGKGQVCRRRGDRRRALEFYARAIEIDKGSEWTTLEYARELIDAGSVVEGLALLHDAVVRYGHSSLCWRLIAQTERERGNYAAARQSLEAASKLSAVKDHAWIELALDDFRRGDVRAATQALQEAIEQRPAFVKPLEALAGFAEAVDDLEGALELFMRARALDASQPNSLIAIARLQAHLGRFEDSQASFAALGKSFGLLPEAELVKAALLRGRGDYTAAQRLLEQAACAFPGHFGVWSAWVSSRIAAGQFAAADRMLQAPPASTARERGRVHALRAQLALAQWRLEAAAVEFEQAFALLPADSGLQRDALRCALLRLDIDEAQRRLVATADLNSNHRALHNSGLKPMQTHEGQLLDEYRIDASALQRLKAAAQSPNPVEAIAALVRNAPNFTPAAIALMVALRRQGSLDGASPPERVVSAIPRKIAQFWDRDIPADVQKLCDTWRGMHPDFAYTLFSAVTARRFLSERSALRELAAFDAAVETAMKADIFRLAYLAFEGGFYIDADDRCLARLDELDREGRQLLLYQEEYGTVGNNFIGAIAEHPVIGWASTQAVEALNRGDADVVWLATGPGILTRAVARFLAEDIAERLPTVRVMERNELARGLAMHCMTSYKYTRKHWSRTSFPRQGPTAGALKAVAKARPESFFSTARRLAPSLENKNLRPIKAVNEPTDDGGSNKNIMSRALVDFGTISDCGRRRFRRIPPPPPELPLDGRMQGSPPSPPPSARRKDRRS